MVTQVFSPSQPGAGQVRRHVRRQVEQDVEVTPGGRSTFAQRTFAGIRNVAAHTVGEWSEQVALEHLAVLSVVARWADETEVVTAP